MNTIEFELESHSPWTDDLKAHRDQKVGLDAFRTPNITLVTIGDEGKTTHTLGKIFIPPGSDVEPHIEFHPLGDDTDVGVRDEYYVIYFEESSEDYFNTSVKREEYYDFVDYHLSEADGDDTAFVADRAGNVETATGAMRGTFEYFLKVHMHQGGIFGEASILNHLLIYLQFMPSSNLGSPALPSQLTITRNLCTSMVEVRYDYRNFCQDKNKQKTREAFAFNYTSSFTLPFDALIDPSQDHRKLTLKVSINDDAMFAQFCHRFDLVSQYLENELLKGYDFHYRGVELAEGIPGKISKNDEREIKKLCGADGGKPFVIPNRRSKFILSSTAVITPTELLLVFLLVSALTIGLVLATGGFAGLPVVGAIWGTILFGLAVGAAASLIASPAFTLVTAWIMHKIASWLMPGPKYLKELPTKLKSSEYLSEHPNAHSLGHFSEPTSATAYFLGKSVSSSLDEQSNTDSLSNFSEPTSATTHLLGKFDYSKSFVTYDPQNKFSEESPKSNTDFPSL